MARKKQEYLICSFLLFEKTSAVFGNKDEKTNKFCFPNHHFSSHFPFQRSARGELRRLRRIQIPVFAHKTALLVNMSRSRHRQAETTGEEVGYLHELSDRRTLDVLFPFISLVNRRMISNSCSRYFCRSFAFFFSSVSLLVLRLVLPMGVVVEERTRVCRRCSDVYFLHRASSQSFVPSRQWNGWKCRLHISLDRPLCLLSERSTASFR